MTDSMTAAPKVGPKLQSLRKQRGLTLDQLARDSGVSKSMLSQIERGQANPTLATVWNLTEALKIDFTDLVGSGPASANETGIFEHLPQHFTPSIKSPDNKCVLKILSPISTATRVEWYEIDIEPGGRFDRDAHQTGTVEHLTCLDGKLVVETGDESKALSAGDTLRYGADRAHAISNPNGETARALLVVISG